MLGSAVEEQWRGGVGVGVGWGGWGGGVGGLQGGTQLST